MSLASLVVLGASGRVGSLIRAAWEQHPVPGLSVRWHSRQPAAGDWIRWDMAEGSDALAQRIGPNVDAVLVLAGVTPASGRDYAANVNLPLSVLEAAGLCGVHQVFLASSSAVYGHPADDIPVPESAALAPVNAYGASKLAMEQAALAWTAAAGAGAPGTTMLRIGNVAGTDQLFRNMLNASTDAPVVLDQFADGSTPSRSYIGPQSFADLVAALARRAALGEPLPDVLNVGAPGGVQMGQLLDALEQAGQPVPHRFQPAAPGTLRRLHLDTALLAQFHRFAPQDLTAVGMVAQCLALQP